MYSLLCTAIDYKQGHGSVDDRSDILANHFQYHNHRDVIVSVGSTAIKFIINPSLWSASGNSSL